MSIHPRRASRDLFDTLYGGPPEMTVRVPGRINLIGEHTDYNDGFVMPMAIELATWVTLRPRRDRTVHIASLGYPPVSFSLNGLERGHDWADYVRGVAWVMGAYRLSGWDGAIATDIPIGAGLSSSAALSVAAVLCFAAVSGSSWEAKEAALVARRSENDWVGAGVGIMDPLIVAAGGSMLIDCRDLTMCPVPPPEGAEIVILDSGTRRHLVDSEYGERRAACERATRAAGVPSLRDLSVSDLPRLAGMVDAVTFRRARHVITENQRVLVAADALGRGDVGLFGRLMVDSHRSLRDDYTVTSEVLDTLVAISLDTSGCRGARMTGAGFGGCVVALVDRSALPDFMDSVAKRWKEATHRRLRMYVGRAAEGGIVYSGDSR